jgi:2-keto-4-pentenoate hydratase/2-oxohepta-3-ene-1,7-dioic acid hydratase in catechol pathway
MRFATILEDERYRAALVEGGRLLPLGVPGLHDVADIAAGASGAHAAIEGWAADRPASEWVSLEEATLGPAVPAPGAIYTIGHNYRGAGRADDGGPDRPLVYGKAGSSVAGHQARLSWDRSLTANVDAECELGVVIGEPAFEVPAVRAMDHVFGYTIINDISSRDPWLDGDQWLIGKSMPGFSPVGPWIVHRDDLDASDLQLGCRIDGTAIQDGRTSQMRFGIAEIIEYLSRHVRLMPGDLIATGTPERLSGPMGPERHLEAGDLVTAWIEGIGELTTIIA